MKKNIGLSVGLSVLLVASQFAFAQDHRRGDRDVRQRPSVSTTRPAPAARPPAYRPPAARPPAHRPPAARPPAHRPPAARPPAHRPPAARPPAYRPPPGYRPSAHDRYQRTDYRRNAYGDFRRGRVIPQYYRGSHYVVDDWRGHGLGYPPRGYHWVQAGGDYLLVAVASGIIAQILIGN